MENRGLLFIPDISGFTRFVNETEIEHSRLIIQELLEILLNSNQSGLEISEIEGDAILFYRFGEPPSLEELYQQVEKMFLAFHKNIFAYEQRKYCQCKACLSAIHLSLKIITHYGEFTAYTVKDFKKLIGKDIIVAHQLLKNDIEKHEYWLVTKSLSLNNNADVLPLPLSWAMGIKQTDNGEIPFQFAQLGHLKSELVPEPLPDLHLSEKVKLFSVNKDFDIDIISLFHATGDLNYRSFWMDGVKKVEIGNHFLPRIGMSCRYIMEKGETITYSSGYNYSADRIEFSEHEQSAERITVYTLEKKAENITRFTIAVYDKKTLVGTILYRIIKNRNKEKSLERSLQNLARFVKSRKF